MDFQLLSNEKIEDALERMQSQQKAYEIAIAIVKDGQVSFDYETFEAFMECSEFDFYSEPQIVQQEGRFLYQFFHLNGKDSLTFVRIPSERKCFVELADGCVIHYSESQWQKWFPLSP